MDEKELLDRIKELEKENAELRKRLGLIDEPLHPDYEEDKYHIGTELASQAAFSESNFDKFRSPEDKIALFCSLFRGREDVYAVRWQSVATGRSGYSPACANEWRAGFCIKPKGSCTSCTHRELLPLTDAVIDRHLRGNDKYGRDVVGVFPILSGDTCFFLAMDFDDEGWQENVSAVRNTCGEWDIPCAVELSRSGSGAHL